jgi:Transcription-repair coupling factor (superfamily II helicase)
MFTNRDSLPCAVAFSNVYSFSNEYPYRVDFFGEKVNSLRTFQVQSQLSRGKEDCISIVPELSEIVADKISFLKFPCLPTTSVVKQRRYHLGPRT